MRNTVVLVTISGALITFMSFGTDPFFYINLPSILFILFFSYAVTLITFGTAGTVKTVQSFKYLFTDEMVGGAKATYLATILKSQIAFTYAGAAIALIVGSISIHANHQTEPTVLHLAYAINLLALFWAVLFCEVLLRPMATKLKTCDLNQ